MALEDRNGEVTANHENATRERSFDELAKELASGSVSRGKALRLMGGAVFGGLLASVPGVAWAAKPTCPSGVKCGRNCCPHASFICSQGKCACPAGTTNCGGQCVDPTIFQTDPSNCGSCGNICSGGKTCQGGACACPTGQTDCGGVCRDLATDVLNCGACGRACSTGQSCVGGQCVCPSGQELCGGQCVSNTCPNQGEAFNPVTCQCECPTGTTLCPGNNTCVQNCSEGQTLDPTTCQCQSATTCRGVGEDCGSPDGPDPNRACCPGLTCSLVSLPGGAGFLCVA